MGDGGVVGDVEGEAGGVDGRLEVEEVAFVQVVGFAVQGQNFGAGQTDVQVQDAVAAMVAGADGDALGVEVG